MNSFPNRRTLWLSLVTLAPVMVLAGLGWMGLRAERQAARLRQMQEADHLANLAQGLFESELDVLLAKGDGWIWQPDAGLPRIGNFVYPDPPSPGDSPRSALELWEAARQAENPEDVARLAEQLAVETLETKPTVLSPRFLEAAEARLCALPARLGPHMAAWRDRWTRDEAARQVLREHAESVAHGEGRWVTLEGQEWFLRRWPMGRLGESHRNECQLVRADQLLSAWESAMRIHAASNPTRLAVSAWGHDLTPPAPSSALVLAERQGPVRAVAYVADRDALGRDQRRIERWFVALLAAALIASVLGVWTMQRALAKARQLSEMKSNFISSVSHELRAPLASMRLLAENLQRERVADEDQKRGYFRHLVEECRRLGALIENVLDFARIEAGRKHYDFAEADVDAAMRDAVALCQPRAEAKNLTVRYESSPLPRQPVVDAAAVQQAALNLLDNAIKFSPEGAEIAVSLGPDGPDRWRVRVADAGPGVAIEEQAKIFDRFYRVGSELTRRAAGAGIGLSLVKHVAEAHGGRARVESQPGQGAVFLLELPYAANSDH